MRKWSDERLKARYEQVSSRRPGGVYATVLKAEMDRRGIA